MLETFDVINIKISKYFVVCAVLTVYVLFYDETLSFLQIIKYEKKTNFDSYTFRHELTCNAYLHVNQCLIYSRKNSPITIIGNETYVILSSNRTDVVFVNPQSHRKYHFASTNPRTIAYLFSIQQGARFIYELHSNAPFYHHEHVQHVAFRRQRSLFVNIYPTFTANFTTITPGVPKDEIKNITEDGWSSIRIIDSNREIIRPLIQQQILVDNNEQSLFVNHPPVAVEPFTFSPFSNEDTLFNYDAFWGLVLPVSKSNIWRSWWVQRILWDINGHVVFTSATHEVKATSGKTVGKDDNTIKLVQFLSTWKSTKTKLDERIKELFNSMFEKSFCDKKELNLIRSWISDLKRINYTFPVIRKNNSSSSSSSTVRRRRTAVCVTGIIECIDEAWRPTERALRTHIKGDMDIFMYLSSSQAYGDEKPSVSQHIRLAQALNYSSFTVKVLFENIPKIDPRFPPNCTTDGSVDQPPLKIPRYYQQLLGLSNCFALVRDYETKYNVKYDIMVRSRVDIKFHKIPSTFERKAPYDINRTLILPPNRHISKVDDGFAIGPIEALEVYMNRFHSFQQCLTRDLHPERYLYFYLKHRNVKMIIDRRTLVVSIPHSPKNCH